MAMLCNYCGRGFLWDGMGRDGIRFSFFNVALSLSLSLSLHKFELFFLKEKKREEFVEIKTRDIHV